MTGSEDPLTSQQEEVRRLLADARHTGSTPPEVVARLDATLEELTSEPDRSASVVDLAHRRRRVGTLLVAAAAVVVVGVGVSQVVTPEPGVEPSSTADSQLESGAAEESQPLSDPKAQSGDSPLNSAEGPTPVDGLPLVELRRHHLAADAITARRQRATFDYSTKADSADRAAGVLCSADAWGSGRFVPVRYGNSPAVLVYRRPVGETQVVDLFLCGSEQPVRSATLPAP